MRRVTAKHHHMVFDILLVAALFAHLSNAQTCTFCENGITNPSLVFNDSGNQTCAEIPILIAGALADSIECSSFQVMENLCCPPSPALDVCTFCENGVTDPSLLAPEGWSCGELELVASELASDDEMCARIKIDESTCCPAGTGGSTSPTASSSAFTESPTAASVASESPTAASLPASLSPTSKPITSQPTWPPTNQVVTSSPTLPPIEVIDMPLPPTGVISGVAFYDSNSNGNRESMLEYGVWDIKVFLYACGDDAVALATTSTSTQGTYQFENLAEGTYYVKFEYPSYYLLGSVWNGDPSTPSVGNSANPENGVTNCLTLNDGDQLKADVAFGMNPNPAPATNPPPTAVATPPPTLPVTTLPPIDAAPPSSLATTQSPTAVVIATSSPTSQSVANATMCAFCEGGIPDLMVTVRTGQTCGAVKDVAANHVSGSDICKIIQEGESVCCPEPLSNPCQFCEGGIPDENLMPSKAGGITCGEVKALTAKESADSILCSILKQPESSCCPPSVDNLCSFCEDGIPDPDYVVFEIGQTCAAIKSAAANQGDGTNICAAIKQAESSCCPAFPTSTTTLPPINTPTQSTYPTPSIDMPTDTAYTPTLMPTQSVAPTLPPGFLSNICTFCEDGMIDANLEIPDRGGETCGSQKDRANSLNGLTPLCKRIQEVEDVCCPEPVTNPCSFCEGGIVNLDLELPQSGGRTCSKVNALAATMEQGSSDCTTLKQAEIECCPPPAGFCTFCQEGIPDPSIVLVGGQSCESMQASAATFPADSELCSAAQAEESKCCPASLEPVPNSTLAPSTNSSAPPTGVPLDLIGPETTNGIEMLLVGVQATEKFREWQEKTAAFIMDYFKINQDIVYDVSVNVTLFFESVTAIEGFKPNRGPIRRQLQSTQSVTITYSQSTTYRSNYPDSNEYDATYIAEEPFKQDPDGYIAMLKRLSSYYDPVSKVTVTVPLPTPPPTPPVPVPAPVKSSEASFWEKNETYIIIGIVCGVVVLIAVVACILIVRKRKRRNEPVFGCLSCCCRKRKRRTGQRRRRCVGCCCRKRSAPDPDSDLPDTSVRKVESDEDLKSRDTSDVFESSGAVAAAAALSSVPSGEVLVHVIAPEGKLGVVVDTPPLLGPAYVVDLREDSPLLGQVHLGDKIIAVDDDDVQRMSAVDVSKLLARKSRNPQRKITILRKGERGEDPSADEAKNPLVAVSSSQDSDTILRKGEQGEDPASYEANPPLVAVSSSQDSDEDTVTTSNTDPTVTVIAPKGKLGLVVENSREGGPAYVSELREGSVLEGKIQLQDRIVSIDDEDVRNLKAFHISKLLASKSQKERKIVVLRGAIGESQNMIDDSSTFTDIE